MPSSFKDLRVWREAIKFTVAVYRVTGRFPKHELYGLTQQLRRAVVSVPSNIAEGRGRGAPRDYRRFLYLARGSLYELDTQIELAAQLGYCREDDVSRIQIAIAGAMRPLQGLISSLNRKIGDN